MLEDIEIHPKYPADDEACATGDCGIEENKPDATLLEERFADCPRLGKESKTKYPKEKSGC